MKKRIADIVTEFSVEGLAEVQRALRALRDQVNRSHARNDSTSRSVAETGTAAKASTRQVGGLNNSLAAAGRSATGIAVAADALTPSLGQSSNAAEDLGRALRQAQQTASNALGGRSGRAGADEVLRYLRELKTAEADLDRLKAAREKADPQTRSTLDEAIGRARGRVSYLEGRLRDGTSEDDEKAARKARKADIEQGLKDEAEVRDQAHREAVRREKEVAREREAIARESRTNALTDEIASARDRDLAEAAIIETERRRYASLQKLRRIAAANASVDHDRDRFYYRRLKLDLDDVDRRLTEVGRGMRAIHLPPSLKGVEAVHALRRAHEDAAFATQLHAQRIRELDGLEVNNLRGGGLGSIDDVDLANVRRLTDDLNRSESAATRLGRSLREAGNGVGGLGGGIGRDGDRASRSIGGLVREINSATRAFRGLSRGGSQALRGIAGTAGGVGKTLSGAVTGTVAKIADMVFDENTLDYGPYIAAAAAAYTFSPLIGLLGGAAAAVAGVVTIEDVRMIRQASEALNLPPDVVQQWQYFGSAVGVAQDTTLGGMHAMANAMQEIASGSKAGEELQELFEAIGLPITEGFGSLRRFRDVSDMMSDLARISRTLTAEQRNFAFKEIFGEGDALELSEMFRKVGEDYDNLNSKFQQRKARGLFVTPEDIAAISEFEALMNDLLWTVKAIARELFLAFQPFFSEYIYAFDSFFSTAEQRRGLIDTVFVKPFERAWRFLQDIMRAFWGFDLDGMLFGDFDTVAPENEWLFTLKKVAIDTWHVLNGLWQVLVGIGELFVGLFRQVDGFGQSLGAVDIENWLKTTAAIDFRNFAGDLRQVLANAFGSALDPASMSTPLGQFVATQVEALKSAVSSALVPTMQYIATAWNEAMGALNAGTGLDGVETILGEIIVLGAKLVDFLPRLSAAFYKVFVEDAPAPEGFAWMGEVKQVIDDISGIFAELGDVLGPVYEMLDGVSESLFGISAATALIIAGGFGQLSGLFSGLAGAFTVAGGAVGLGAMLAGIAVPLGAVALAIAATAGGIAVLYNLMTDFTGTVERFVGLLGSAWDKISSWGSSLFTNPLGDQSTMPVPEMPVRTPQYANTLIENYGRYAPQDRTRIDEMMADISTQDATIAQQLVQAQEAVTQAAQATTEAGAATVNAQTMSATTGTMTTQAGQATVEAGSVSLVTSGTPITIQLPGGGSATGLFEPSETDALLRSLANRIGR